MRFEVCTGVEVEARLGRRFATLDDGVYNDIGVRGALTEKGGGRKDQTLHKSNRKLLTRVQLVQLT